MLLNKALPNEFMFDVLLGGISRLLNLMSHHACEHVCLYTDSQSTLPYYKYVILLHHNQDIMLHQHCEITSVSIYLCFIQLILLNVKPY